MLRRIQPFTSRTPKEALGLPPYTITRHDVPISDTQADVYDLVEDNFRRRLEDAQSYRDKIDSLRRERPIRLLQAATNPDLLNRADSSYRLGRIDNPTPTLMERLDTFRAREQPAKSLFALELLREIAGAGQKTVVWSNFIGNLDQFAAMVLAELHVPCFQVDGRVPTGDEAELDDPAIAPVDGLGGETRERRIESFLTTDGEGGLNLVQLAWQRRKRGRLVTCRMLQLLLLLLRTLLTAVRSRREVAFENLVLRHQLQVALRTYRHLASAFEIALFGYGCSASGPGGARTW